MKSTKSRPARKKKRKQKGKLYTRSKKQQLLKDMKKYERKSTNDDGIHPRSKQ